MHLPGGPLIPRVGLATYLNGTNLAALEERRGDPGDRGCMNDVHSRAAGKAPEFAARDIEPILSDAAAMSDAAAVVAASVVLGLAFLILS